MISVFFAPMEGVTDAPFRRVHHRCFSGVEAYYIPFISPTQNMMLTSREKRNVLPEYNEGVPCVPQILTKDPEHFIWAAKVLHDMGYTEVNLNVGCPSGTVTAKSKGAGLLRKTELLERLLDAVCESSPLPVSVKTRIGYDSSDEWERIMSIYASYPLRRLIIHPRTRQEGYDPNRIHSECFHAAEILGRDIIYNGDIFSAADAQMLLDSCERPAGIMCGRGLVANPALGREINGGAAVCKDEIVRFHDMLVEEYQSVYQQDIVFMRMRVVMKMIACCFDGAEREEKLIRKSGSLRELLMTDRQLFDRCELREHPSFVPEGERKNRLNADAI